MNRFIIIISISAIIIIILMLKKLKPSQIILCVLSGIAALFACDFIMSLYGGNMPLNIYTVIISALGGLPSVILLLLLKTFML
ncbi:MAG: pro-sigmaK processing inhibitor BofA family protein [Clostridia bacterium]|nr:pro-sigmaK processing inhibitor BofA family protein [Clostridia bacterium]